MEISPVMRPLALDAVMPVAADGADPLLPAGPAASAPGSPAGHGLQSAALQTFARPHAPGLEPLRSADTALATAVQAGAASSVVVEQLVPATVSSLQVDAAVLWPVMRHGTDTVWPLPPRPPQAETHPPRHTPEPAPESEAEVAAPGEERRDAGPAFEDADDADWCVPLTAALRDALAAKVPPPALLAANDQWRRGRCVVLACPQTPDPTGRAWAFVLWPRPRPRTGGPASTLPPTALQGVRGLRVEARLTWSVPPDRPCWCHARVVKEHHPRRGRQLVPLDDGTGAAPRCEIQLGPVLARSLRWSEVRVRIDAVRRFWAALGTQWSATVVVCSQPLAGARPAEVAESIC